MWHFHWNTLDLWLDDLASLWHNIALEINIEKIIDFQPRVMVMHWNNNNCKSRSGCGGMGNLAQILKKYMHTSSGSSDTYYKPSSTPGNRSSSPSLTRASVAVVHQILIINPRLTRASVAVDETVNIINPEHSGQPITNLPRASVALVVHHKVGKQR